MRLVPCVKASNSGCVSLICNQCQTPCVSALTTDHLILTWQRYTKHHATKTLVILILFSCSSQNRSFSTITKMKVFSQLNSAASQIMSCTDFFIHGGNIQQFMKQTHRWDHNGRNKYAWLKVYKWERTSSVSLLCRSVRLRWRSGGCCSWRTGRERTGARGWGCAGPAEPHQACDPRSSSGWSEHYGTTSRWTTQRGISPERSSVCEERDQLFSWKNWD